jgi:hypothetical protein
VSFGRLVQRFVFPCSSPSPPIEWGDADTVSRDTKLRRSVFPCSSPSSPIGGNAETVSRDTELRVCVCVCVCLCNIYIYSYILYIYGCSRLTVASWSTLNGSRYAEKKWCSALAWNSRVAVCWMPMRSFCHLFWFSCPLFAVCFLADSRHVRKFTFARSLSCFQKVTRRQNQIMIWIGRACPEHLRADCQIY